MEQYVSGEGKKYYYFSIMSATEDWLRYIENRVIRDRYGMKGYEGENKDEEEKETEENTKESSGV